MFEKLHIHLMPYDEDTWSLDIASGKIDIYLSNPLNYEHIIKRIIKDDVSL